MFGPLLHRLHKSESGAAAVEMALMLPLVMIIMFGGYEMGHYFWNQHIVVKSVRDGARYAARLPFSKFDCDNADLLIGNDDPANAGNVDDDTIAQIKLLTRTGQIADPDAPPKIDYWGDDTVTVAISCPTTDFATGLYDNLPNAPRVTVSVSNLTYPSLFSTLGFDTSTVTLEASSRAAVMGL
jgi:TadE-like protein